MGIFRRVNDIVTANLNDLVDRFEEPETMLRQAIREMESSIADATGAAAKAIASERLMSKQFTEHERQATEWQERAEQAVRAGDDELARHALRRKRDHDQLARALSDQLTAARESGDRLRRQVDAMKAKHAEARRKLATLTARCKVAHARKSLLAAGSHHSTVGFDAFARFERMRDKVDQTEAEADALAELCVSPSFDCDAFTQRDDEAIIDSELAAIKQRLAT